MLSRCATIAAGAALAAVALPASPAAAYSSASCPEASSTRLVTGAVLGDGINRLWAYSPSPTTTIICFDVQTRYGTPLIGGAASS